MYFRRADNLCTGLKGGDEGGGDRSLLMTTRRLPVTISWIEVGRDASASWSSRKSIIKSAYKVTWSSSYNLSATYKEGLIDKSCRLKLVEKLK